jgi:hypothetical protein
MNMFLWSYRQKSTSKKRRSAPNRYQIVAELYGFIRVDEMVNFSLTGKSLSSLFIQLTFVPMLGPSPLVALEFFVFLPDMEQVSKKQTPLSQA